MKVVASQPLPKFQYRPLKLFLECSVKAERLASWLDDQFQEWRHPKKADSTDYRQQCRETLRMVTLNLITVTLSGGDIWLQTPASRGWYAQNRHWIGNATTLATVTVCREFLLAQGYVGHYAGNSSSSRRYWRPAAIRPTDSFSQLVSDFSITTKDVWRSANLDIIQLRGPKQRDGSKPRLPLTWTDEVSGMADNLHQLNLRLNSARIGINVTKAQWAEIMEHISKKQDAELELADAVEGTLDLTQRALYRVFNNGELAQGGRFYGGWWQSLPKKWRSYITINGRKVVEVDYAAMHPTALSHELGLPAPEKFYEFGLGTKPVVKATFNALINARGTSINQVSGFDEAAVGMSWSDFRRAVKNHYAPYRSYFGTGHGLKLQRLDADIAEAVMLHFAGKGEVVLPVHDSFLCEQRLEAELAFVMEEEFSKRTGGTIGLKAKRLTARQIAALRAHRLAFSVDLQHLRLAHQEAPQISSKHSQT